MKKLYYVFASLMVCNISLAQRSSAFNEITFGNTAYLAKVNVSNDLNTSSDFSNPFHNHSQYNQMVEREMARYQYMASAMVAGTGLDYDVKYYRLELRINPDTSIGKYIRGKVTTYFKNISAGFNVIKFDFAAALACDSVYYHGVKLAANKKVENGDVLEITIPTIIDAGTLDSVSVFYKGVPPAVPDLGGGLGFVKGTHGKRLNYIYTLSEAYSAYTWWPCKSMVTSDKADSMDMIISTPTGFKAAGNGTKVYESTIGNKVLTYWKHRYPISSYQVCTAVANYVQYPTTPTLVNIGGTQMPLYNFIFPETNTTGSQAALNKTALMLTTFSSKYGDYPFKNEKYGHYTFGFGGGMEHNTFSGMSANTYSSSSSWDIIAHELGHQWFGGSVTCGSWRDIWLNESFATYSEIVCAEFAPSITAGQTGLSWRQSMKSKVMSSGNQAQSVYVTDTSSTTTIFTPSVYIYERGAMVLSMLRTLLGDAKFFQALQNYQADSALRYGTALTGDVQRHMENVSGLDLSTFFTQWIYNKGVANYAAAKWNNAGTQLVLQLPQTTLYSTLSHFDMPVAVRIRGAVSTQDTTIIAYDQNGILYYDNDAVLTSDGSNMLSYNLSFVPATITFDGYSQVLANGTFTKDANLPLPSPATPSFRNLISDADYLPDASNDITVTPNPAKDFIMVRAGADIKNMNISIYDNAGRLVKKDQYNNLTNKASIKVSVSKLTPGNYFVEINNGSTKLAKKIIIIK
ncbi:MAG: M1 family aminopeptidase [Ferruginibacter sp.]